MFKVLIGGHKDRAGAEASRALAERLLLINDLLFISTIWIMKIQKSGESTIPFIFAF
jgi:hypothetical protein